MLHEIATQRAIDRENLAVATGYSLTSSQFMPSLNLLKRNGLIEADGDLIRLSETLEVHA